MTLAHHGVLFLDELPEFSKKTLEVLREPIEDRQITVSRANATLTFPSSIILLAAMNEVTSITIRCNEMRETPLCGVVGIFEETYSICSKNMTLIYLKN